MWIATKSLSVPKLSLDILENIKETIETQVGYLLVDDL